MLDSHEAIDDLTPDQRQLAILMLTAVLTECRQNDLALLQEGYMKGVVAKACINSGFELREGSHDSGRDWLIRRDGGVLVTRNVHRETHDAAGGSRDVRIEAPRLHVELKCFGEFGAKDFLDRGESGVRGDLERIRDRHADAFLLAVAGKLYDDARGDKVEQRGRKAADANVLSFLPERRSFPETGLAAVLVEDGQQRFALRGGRAVTPGGRYGTTGTGDRVVILVSRGNAVSHGEGESG